MISKNLTRNNKEYDVSHLLHEAWTVDGFFLTLNGQIIRTEDIVSYDIKYLGGQINGLISFRDIEGLKEKGYVSIGGFIKAQFISQPRSKSGGGPVLAEQTFFIQKVRVDESVVPIVNLIVSDVINPGLAVVYTNDSYQDIEIGEVFTKMSESVSGLFTVLPPKENKEVKQNITISAAIPLLHTFKNLAKRENYTFLIDKAGAVLTHKEHIQQEKLDQNAEFYYYRPDRSRQHIRNQILEFDLDGFDNKGLLMPDAITSEITNTNTGKGEIVSASVTQTKIESSPNNVADLRVFSGTGATSANADISRIRDALNDLSTCSVIVPGWAGNRIFQMVEIELPLNAIYKQTTNEQTFSGKWAVAGYRDKIINTYYIQELYLRRAGQ